MTINGKEVRLKKDVTLLEYLQVCQYDVAKVAVERNGEIVPKADYRKVVLERDDVIEIVKFIGGG